MTSLVPASEQSAANVPAVRAAINAGELTVREVVEAAVSRIDAFNPAVNAMVECQPEAALHEADLLDSGEDPRCNGLLAGIPITAKITTETIDLPTTYASRAFIGAMAGFDAAVIARMRTAGAVLVGKTNAPELTLRSTTENELYGPTRNPWNTSYSPGGSSGGAGVAVALSMCSIAQGNDAGGSIRIPAACSGVVGLKPSRGRIPWAPGNYEVWAGLATNGVLTRTVADAGYALDVVAGPELGDPYAVADGEASFYAAAVHSGTEKAVRLAYTCTPPHGDVAPVIRTAFEKAVEIFSENASITHEDHPSWDDLEHIFVTIVAGNVAAFGESLTEHQLARLEPTTLALVLAGSRASAATYCHAVDEARLRAAEIVRFWRDYDYLLTPTVTTLPPRCEETVPDDPTKRLRRLMDWQPFLYPFNITGQPAISIPMGYDSETGLPMALQIVGRPGDDAGVLRQAAFFEQAQPWTSPDLASGAQAPEGVAS